MTADLEKLVKPLVWEGHSDHVRAGDHGVMPTYGQGPKDFLMYRGSKMLGYFDTIEAAKAAAQADYARRIAAALDPDAVAAMVQKAKAEALQGPWEDKPDDLTEAVNAAHPCMSRKNWDIYTAALEAVSNRHSKGALVSLVSYLMIEAQEAVQAEREACAKVADIAETFEVSAAAAIRARGEV